MWQRSGRPTRAQDNWIFFVVRDDDRSPEAQALVVIPTATYQAYNTWGGKSLYFDKNGGADTVSGTKRAVKVSFNRPLDDPTRQRDGYFGPDFDMVQWLEEQGYDVTYTDDVAIHQDPTELRQHEVVLIPAIRSTGPARSSTASRRPGTPA